MLFTSNNNISNKIQQLQLYNAVLIDLQYLIEPEESFDESNMCQFRKKYFAILNSKLVKIKVKYLQYLHVVYCRVIIFNKNFTRRYFVNGETLFCNFNPRSVKMCKLTLQKCNLLLNTFLLDMINM